MYVIEEVSELTLKSRNFYFYFIVVIYGYILASRRTHSVTSRSPHATSIVRNFHCVHYSVLTFNKMNSADNFDLEYRLFKEHSQSTVISDESHSGCESSSGGNKTWSHLLNQPESNNDSIYRKPTHSYSSLISEAIRLSTKGQLTLNEIYTWLVDKFPYFKAAGTGWKVIIHHIFI